MAIKKISELPEAMTVEISDQVVLNKGGITLRAAVGLLTGTGSGSGGSAAAPSASQLAPAGLLDGGELLVIERLSTTVKLTATTISAHAVDNSFVDSGNGFVAAGFAVGQRVRVQGFTGDEANNIYSGTLTSVSAGKIIVGSTDGDVIVDDAAGEAVTITAWQSLRTTAAAVAALAAAAGGSAVPGYQVAATPAGFYLASSGTETTPTSRTFGIPLTLASPMYVASLVLSCSTSATGIVRWALLDPHPDPSAATIICGGSAALSATGIREIAADAAPVLVPAGQYILALRFPDANCPSVHRQNSRNNNVVPGIAQRKKDGLVWGTTLDLTAGWSDDVAVLWTYLRGRLSATVTW